MQADAGRTRHSVSDRTVLSIRCIMVLSFSTHNSGRVAIRAAAASLDGSACRAASSTVKAHSIATATRSHGAARQRRCARALACSVQQANRSER